MQPGGDTAEEVRRLLSQRADVMAMLVDRACRKRELTDALDVSRSTVDRAIRQLETNDLVRRDGGKVAATVGGRLAYDSYRSHCETTALVVSFGDLLRHLPEPVDIGADVLQGATAYRSEPPATGRPSNEVTALFKRGTRVRGCANVINDSAAAEEFSRLVTERGGSGEFVYDTALADHLRAEYFEMTHELVSTGRFRAYETTQLPYELFLVDDERTTHVAVLVYDGSDTLRGAIVNDTDAAVRWGEATFERRRREATEFTDDFRVGDEATTGDGGRDAPGG